MIFSSFDEMQKAVDIVGDSPHETNKIAATIFGTGPDKKPYSVARTNYWPQVIADHIGQNTKIGNSSGTVHAETACILAAPFTDGASLCITDPFCPNCAKNMAEAGVRTIYIDHKGFDKDFADRRGDHFKLMSMQICERAGINVYEIHRKNRTLTPILEIPETYVPYNENPVTVEPVKTADDDTFQAVIDEARRTHRGRKFAVAAARSTKGDCYALTACAHPAIGYSSDEDSATLHNTDGKYSYMQEPLNRLLMNAPRRGLPVVNGLLYCSQVPTAREQVNMVGAGLDQIIIGDRNKARDSGAHQAMKHLATAGIIKYFGITYFGNG